ncbi:MAG: DUF4157 domain-containing protein [Gammaproteobacteria bacterium]
MRAFATNGKAPAPKSTAPSTGGRRPDVTVESRAERPAPAPATALAFGQIAVHPPGATLLRRPPRFSRPGDADEREADRVASQVLASPLPGSAPAVGPRRRTSVLPSAGRPLDGGAAAFLSPRFGADLSHVRVHTDPTTAAAARAFGSRAFTVGSDIGFGRGEYRPGTTDGRHLLAHEVAHTFQGGDVVRRSPLSDQIQAVWTATPTLEALLARLGQSDVQAAQSDADVDALLATLLASRAEDLWVAQQIRHGQLGSSAGGRAIEVHYVQGTTDQRALVIAGVHGSERQGIEVVTRLVADLAVTQPRYTVILVPSLFPDNAAAGTREGSIPTNRNFPSPSQDLAAATTAGGGTPVDAVGRSILPENVMLLHLIERFRPARIISVHGTWRGGAGGVFYDPVTPTAADHARLRAEAEGLAYMQVLPEDHDTLEGQRELREHAQRNYRRALDAFVHRDQSPALAAATQIDAATTGITGREQRGMLREGESAIPNAERDRRRAHPSVAGNVGPSGDVDTAFWSGGTPGGTSLGGYASGRGISVFTVEPPINRTSAQYPTGADARVAQAERQTELQAYADALRTVLLGR